jgi:hypothetical protein
LAANGSSAPEIPSIMARPYALVSPLMDKNLPPANTLPLPAGAVSARTSASALGAHGSTAPAAEMAASRVRAWLLTTVKMPPT